MANSEYYSRFDGVRIDQLLESIQTKISRNEVVDNFVTNSTTNPASAKTVKILYDDLESIKTNYLPLTGAVMQGGIDMDNKSLKNPLDPVDDAGVGDRGYNDNRYVLKGGASSNLNLDGFNIDNISDPTNGSEVGNRDYNDNRYLQLTGGLLAGSILYPDNISAFFGDSNDMSISHNGTDSNISNGTGRLNITQTANDNLLTLLARTGGNLYEQIYVGGGTPIVSLNYAGISKLITSSTGVDINGKIKSTNLSGNGDVELYADDDGFILAKSAPTPIVTTGVGPHLIWTAPANLRAAVLVVSISEGSNHRVSHVTIASNGVSSSVTAYGPDAVGINGLSFTVDVDGNLSCELGSAASATILVKQISAITT